MNKSETVKKLSASISPLRKLLWFSKRHAYLCGVAGGHSSRDEEVKELESERDHWRNLSIDQHIEITHLQNRNAEFHRALEGVNAVVLDSFRDAGGVGSEHRTEWECPLCFSGYSHDEDCPAILVKAALKFQSKAVKP